MGLVYAVRGLRFIQIIMRDTDIKCISVRLK